MSNDAEKQLKDIKNSQVQVVLAVERMEGKTERSWNLFIAAAKRMEDGQISMRNDVSLLCGRIGSVSKKVNIALACCGILVVAVLYLYFGKF
jgi:hypothetical protein